MIEKHENMCTAGKKKEKRKEKNRKKEQVHHPHADPSHLRTVRSRVPR